MMYALVQNGSIVQVGALPIKWRDANGEYHDWRAQPYRTQPEDHGWLPVVREPRPDDTATTTWEQQPAALIDGVPTIRYVERDKTPEELAAEQAAIQREANRATVKAVITDLQAEKARAQTVIDKANNQVTGADTKDVARAVKRVADAAIDLARFVQDN